MQDIRASFISTALNEEESIEKFLSSIISNSVLPSEVVLVDAYSTDKTFSLMEKFKKRYRNKMKIKILQRGGNRSIGRNEAIKNTDGSIIVSSDVGCVLHRNFFRNILNPFKDKSVDVVSGYYKPVAKSVFQKCLAAYTSVMPDKIDPENFLPSARSMAFKKKLWEKVRGYPENLDTCEDLDLDKKLKKIGAKFIFNKDALVFWPQRKNIGEAVIQFFNYAFGDGMAHFFRKQTPFLFLRYLAGIILFLLGFVIKSQTLINLIISLVILYFAWSVLKNYKYVQKPEALVVLPLLQLVSDVAVLTGTSLGYIKSLWVIQKTR
jgi:glycosyltransferase involved in cell wall biosynthesis